MCACIAAAAAVAATSTYAHRAAAAAADRAVAAIRVAVVGGDVADPANAHAGNEPLDTLVATTSVVFNEDVLVVVLDDAMEDDAAPWLLAAALPSPLA
jgi:hypothetical protein